MQFQRSSGVLLHIASLPSPGGIGDLGPAAHQFIGFLQRARQHIWQVLPLGPTGFGNSPYAATSAFAGNPALISLEVLRDWGWIAADRIAGLSTGSSPIDFDGVEKQKFPLLREAAGNFLDRALDESALAGQDMEDQWADFEAFCREQAAWLDDYALYAVLRRTFKTGAWTEWPEPLRRRDPQALAQAAAEHARERMIEQVLQFAFSQQWNLLQEAAARSAIRILGDVAIFVNMDSADVWVHPEIFELDEELKPIRIAGVPPDYFSAHRPALGQPALSLGCARRTRLRLVDRAHPPRLRALRHRPPRPLPRLRGLLGDSCRREDGGQRRVGQGAGARALPRAGSGAGAAAAGGRGPGR